MTLPNLIIGGAPKCGTSSVFLWLGEHPEVATAMAKEPFYLMDRDHPLRRESANWQDHGIEGYRSLFAHCPTTATIVAEGTTHYLYQNTAREVLADLPSRPKVVFLLRKPSARIYSSFRYSQHNLAVLDPSLTFADFVARVRARDLGPAMRSDADSRSTYVLEREIRYSHYADYIEAWQASLGRERVLVYLFECMRRDPRTFMKGLASSIGIDPGFYDSHPFTPSNETYAVRNPRLHRVARAIRPRRRGSLMHRLAKRVYMRFLTSELPKSRDAADAAALRSLDEELAPHNRRLAEIMNLDLSPWQ